MPTVAFHFNAPNKLAYACRLLRKASVAGSTIAVVGDESLLSKLDEQLWSFSALDFVPHGRFDALSPAQRSATPIWLCLEASHGQSRQVLINLLQVVPADIESYDRVIEVVSQEESDKQSARLRWKQYVERRIEIVKHDLKLTS